MQVSKDLQLSGPFSVEYLENQNGKTIILLGDVHASTEGECTISSALEVAGFIDYLSRVFPDQTIDFYLESVFDPGAKDPQPTTPFSPV